MSENRTLTQLEGRDWGEPDDDSHLVTTCHKLRHKPLTDFSTEDLRIMIGQDISLEYLMPIALKLLKHRPIAAGDYFPGDLLCSVLRASPEFFDSNPEYRKEAESLLKRALRLVRDDKTVRKALLEAQEMFDRGA